MKFSSTLVLSALGLIVTYAQAPEPPVVFLHYDYMVSTDPANPHTHQPHQESIDRAIDAFKQQGIILHIDPRPAAIPEQPLNVCEVNGNPFGGSFLALKHQYFAPHGNQAWHYVIFGHDNQCWDSDGLAELPGYNFIVTLDNTFTFFSCYDDFTDLCLSIEAGTFMHELGHNLDLRHGGGDDINNKPNYLSVMNYIWLHRGVPSADAPESAVIARWRTDYSGLELPTLDENHLDERVGLGGPPGDTDISAAECEFALVGCVFRAVPTNGPIDWNGNGVIETDVAANLNVSWDCGPTPTNYPACLSYHDILTGFDDWGHLQQFLRTPAYVRGLVQTKTIQR